MKYSNLTLITLNNTLHIKADNLEAVEVDSSCLSEISQFAIAKYDKWLYEKKLKAEPFDQLNIPISELSDRIEVREVETKCGHCNKIYRCTHCGESCGREGHFTYTDKAFLLPEKEDKCDGTCADNECICAEVRRQELKEMKKTAVKIEEAIRETLVVQNPQSIHIAVDKIRKVTFRGSLPSIDEAGVMAVTVSEAVEPKLTAQEQAFFIAGFCECIKWLE